MQLRESLLYQLLDVAGIVDILVFAESISGAALSVLAEVVGGELVALAEELAVLCVKSLAFSFLNSSSA